MTSLASPSAPIPCVYLSLRATQNRSPQWWTAFPEGTTPTSLRPHSVPDSRHFCYFAYRGKKKLLVVDGRTAAAYDAEPSDSNMSSLLGAKIVFDTPDAFHTISARDGNIYVVRDRLK